MAIQESEGTDLATAASKRTELVAVFHGPHGTYKVAAISPPSMIECIIAQTTEGGAMLAHLYRREPKSFPELLLEDEADKP